jgi:hypothetical protein
VPESKRMTKKKATVKLSRTLNMDTLKKAKVDSGTTAKYVIDQLDPEVCEIE